MDNVTVDSLKKIHGDKAESVFREIADRGGFGAVQTDYVGGLDVRGVIDPNNKALSEAQKNKIAELAGMTKKDRDRIEAGETTGTK